MNIGYFYIELICYLNFHEIICDTKILIYSILGIPYYMSAVLAPTLGFVIDRTGRNVAWVMFSCVSTLIAHCLLITQSSQTLAYVAMVIMGIGYSTLACSLWVIIALVVPLHRQGTAYGMKLLKFERND